ncbi:winged helix-turn-helix transcriptional regulator [Rhodococcus qingshengii]|uniref:winged helix-turn-helix transcriptional regulator n=1 Tax=Rhodococcus qingshengii TaxID=334542 RepID=UPI0036DD97E1
MTRRSYQQFCGLASALDAVGERWTLLIVRDLMGGPKRYTDLAASLHGIGTSLLAERVKQLELDKIIARRDLPPPAASTVYELTDIGWELADALIVPLAVWGARHQLNPKRQEEQRFRPEWSLTVFARRLAAQGRADTAVYDFTIDGERAHITQVGPSTALVAGPAPAPADATIVADSASVAALIAGRLNLTEAFASGAVNLTGTETALQALVAAIPNQTP